MISVIIPIHQDIKFIEKVIHSITQSGKLVEIIAVTDNKATLYQLEQYRAINKTLSIFPQRGRGNAIVAGLMHAEHDHILILHADTTLPPNWFDAVKMILNQDEYVGGGFSLCFNRSNFYLQFLIGVTRLLFALSGEFWGDRAMFFKKSVIKDDLDLFNIPLLEDVRLSNYLKWKGKTKLLNDVVISDSEKFYKTSMLRHSLRIIVCRGLFALGFSPERIFSIYYPKHKKSKVEVYYPTNPTTLSYNPNNSIPEH